VDEAMDEFRESYSEEECDAEFDRLFPHGFSGSDIRREIAWDKFADISESDPDRTERNIRELVGRCLWDIFSDQHEVIATDGRLIDLGSFRRTGEFLADFLNRRMGRRNYDYMNFYMGTSAPWAETQDDLTPIYELIFRRLNARGLDWVYHFPQIHLVDFRPLRDALDREGKPDWENYSPSDALVKEFEDRQRDREIAEFRDQLEEGRKEAIEEALRHPPPPTVLAFRNVNGHWPQGWPPA
jgi:hypothetical protein